MNKAFPGKGVLNILSLPGQCHRNDGPDMRGISCARGVDFYSGSTCCHRYGGFAGSEERVDDRLR